MQPTDNPRKQAISTTLVKYVRKITVLPSHRIQASSKNSARKLTRNSSSAGRVERVLHIPTPASDALADDPIGLLN
jgi:hypothetical protein